MKGLAAVLFLFVLVGALPGQTELRVAAVEYPPFTTAGGTNGLAFELLRAALPDYRVTAVVLPYNRAEEEFRAGRLPVSLFNNDYTDLPGMVHLVNQNVRMEFFWDGSRGPLRWDTLADLRGKVLAIGRATRPIENDPLLRPLLDAGVKCIEVESVETAFRMLASGRHDLVLAVDLTGRTAVRRLFGDGSSLVPLDKPYLVIPGGPWFNTALPGIAQAAQDFRKGMASLVKDGRGTAILERYCGKGKVPPGFLVP